MNDQPSSNSDPSFEQRVRHFFQLGLDQGCPKDQLRNFSNTGVILQPRQLAASAAARLCDQPDGPKEIGYGGARGGGKTHWLFVQIAVDDCQRVPGLKCLLLRKVGKSNLESMEDLRRRVLAEVTHDFNASRGLLTFPNGSRIVLGHYQCEKDIDKYLGLEYDVIGIEEATQLTRRKYEDISTCCRSSKILSDGQHWRPRIYSTTNPGGIGHQWYFEKFIIPHQCGTQTSTRFIPARVEDNAFINPEYESNLSSRTGWQYKAWRLGQWDFPAGQYFKNFNPEVHIIGDQFNEADALEWFAALDYGYTHLTVALLGCCDRNDNLYVLDEHAERFWIPERHAQAIKAMLNRHHLYASDDHAREAITARYPEPCAARDQLWSWREKRMLARFVAGADMFSSESNGASIARQYRDLGLKLRPADMDRVSGWSAVSQRFGDPAASIPARLFIHRRCKRLLETLPYLQHDPDRPGDVLKTNINEEGVGGDDAADALRYLVFTKPRVITTRRLRGF